MIGVQIGERPWRRGGREGQEGARRAETKRAERAKPKEHVPMLVPTSGQLGFEAGVWEYQRTESKGRSKKK